MRHQRTGKRVTLQDIARKTGYSLTTVSRALRNMSDIGPEATACIQQTAREMGYVETLLHRRRDLPELKSSNFNLRSFGERVALNMPVQGTAADVMKLAMVAVHKRLKAENLQARLVLQVHDELIVECPEAQAETAAKLLEEEMEHVVRLSVPLTAEAHWGKNWLEAKG